MDMAIRRQLELDIAAISRDCVPPRAPVLSSEPPPDRPSEPPPSIAEPEDFAAWLLVQCDRGDWIDELAAAARADRAFPKRADAETIRRYLANKGIADPDVYEQLDDADRMWRSQ